MSGFSVVKYRVYSELVMSYSIMLLVIGMMVVRKGSGV